MWSSWAKNTPLVVSLMKPVHPCPCLSILVVVCFCWHICLYLFIERFHVFHRVVTESFWGAGSATERHSWVWTSPDHHEAVQSIKATISGKTPKLSVLKANVKERKCYEICKAIKKRDGVQIWGGRVSSRGQVRQRKASVIVSPDDIFSYVASARRHSSVW